MEKGKGKHIRVKKHISVKHEWCEDIFFLLLMYFLNSNNVHQKYTSSPKKRGNQAFRFQALQQ